jgi:hypothetical protein
MTVSTDQSKMLLPFIRKNDSFPKKLTIFAILKAAG